MSSQEVDEEAHSVTEVRFVALAVAWPVWREHVALLGERSDDVAVGEARRVYPSAVEQNYGGVTPTGGETVHSQAVDVYQACWCAELTVGSHGSTSANDPRCAVVREERWEIDEERERDDVSSF